MSRIFGHYIPRSLTALALQPELMTCIIYKRVLEQLNCHLSQPLGLMHKSVLGLFLSVHIVYILLSLSGLMFVVDSITDIEAFFSLVHCRTNGVPFFPARGPGYNSVS